MDHRYLKLIVLVEEGSYSKAAKRLRVSQPAMTIAIASLEMGLNQKLFVQKKPQVVLSESGRIVYNAAKKIKKDIDVMNSKLKLAQTGTVQVGIIDSIAHLVYSNANNNIILNDIEAMVDNSKKIINDIIEREIELGFITGQINSLPKNLTFQKLNNEEFVFVKKASLVTDDKVKQVDDWLCFNRASTSYRHFTKLFKELGMRVNPIFFSTSLDLLKEMAINGKGTALLPRHFVKHDINKGYLKALNTPNLYRPIWVVARKDSHLPILPKLTNHIDNLLIAK